MKNKILILITVVVLLITGCGPSVEELEAVDFTPLEIDDVAGKYPRRKNRD